jgi:hypothetical protein
MAATEALRVAAARGGAFFALLLVFTAVDLIESTQTNP